MPNRKSLIAQSLFYIIAGLNHFINPDFYIPIIPDYLPEKGFVNIASGIAEVLLGAGLLSEKTIKSSTIGITIMLIAFVPSHIYFIHEGSCVAEGLCVSPIISWIRLIIIHPLLIMWALSFYRTQRHPLMGN
ncbi:MAG: hypothetical protein RIC80_09200 [Cyclobacteriaceae bacterium]